MKKILFSALVALVLLWNCSNVFAQGKGGDKGPAGENRRAKGAREVSKARRPVDPNTIRRYREAKRIPKTGPEQERVREMREKRREELLKMREERRKEREKMLSGRDIRQPGDELTKGKDHQQQLKALEKQMTHEEAKHLKRVARLKRIRELATGENSKQIIARVEKLRQKEQLRYVRKHDRMQRRRDMLMRIQGGIRPPDEKMLKAETRKAIERRALMEKGKGKTKSEKKGAAEGAEQ